MSSLANAFHILDVIVAQQTNGMTFTQVLDESGLPRSSAHRLLKELTTLKVLTYDPETKTYRGGLSLAALGAQVTSNLDIRQHSRPALKALQAALGNVVTLSICGEDSGIYIDKIEPSDFGLRLHSEIGKSFPLHCTAMGKVHLAFGDEALREKITTGELEAFTENTITDPALLTVALHRVKMRGYAIDFEEISRGLTCIAAPIFGQKGNIVAALSLTAPSHIYKDGQPSAQIIETVVAHAQQASLT